MYNGIDAKENNALEKREVFPTFSPLATCL